MKDKRDCHIEPDWVLVYAIDKEMLVLYRTGTHADLFRMRFSDELKYKVTASSQSRGFHFDRYLIHIVGCVEIETFHEIITAG